MSSNKCKICSTEIGPRAKICKDNKCISKWKMIRTAKLTHIKNCKQCGSEFTTNDRRNNFCSYSCKSESANNTKIEKYGKDSLYVKKSKQERSQRKKDSYKRYYQNNKDTIRNIRKAYYEQNKPKWKTYSNEVIKNCENCSKEFLASQHGVKHCSLDCAKESKSTKLSESRMGLDPWNKGEAKLTSKEILDFASSNNLTIINIPEIPLMRNRLTVKCECGREFRPTIANFMQPKGQFRCGICTKSLSKPEAEILEFVKSIYKGQVLSQSKPPFMNGLELDIYLPAKNFAIEHHGLAFHSERPLAWQKDLSRIKTLHREKYELCKKEEVHLIQLFEDEWRDKKDICKNIIKSKLGLGQKIYARNTEFKILNSKEAREFFDSNHIAGHTQASNYYGLTQEGVVVCAISFRSTWNKAYGENVIEIARFASLEDYTVIGGFSKLLSHVDMTGFNKILTYSDLRFGEGKVYEKAGFNKEKTTKPNYFYERGGIRENRFKHRKSEQLTGSTEREQQNLMGWFAIYDCGSNVFLKQN